MGDYEAAKKNGVWFYPIVVNNEKAGSSCRRHIRSFCMELLIRSTRKNCWINLKRISKNIIAFRTYCRCPAQIEYSGFPCADHSNEPPKTEIVFASGLHDFLSFISIAQKKPSISDLCRLLRYEMERFVLWVSMLHRD